MDDNILILFAGFVYTFRSETIDPNEATYGIPFGYRIAKSVCTWNPVTIQIKNWLTFIPLQKNNK